VSAETMDARVEYDADDRVWAAVFLRDGEPWYLDGACVGIGPDPGGALDDLVRVAAYLVHAGGNFLTDGPIRPDDRAWLAGRVGTDPSRWVSAVELRDADEQLARWGAQRDGAP
jgi:hypothetical protein